MKTIGVIGLGSIGMRHAKNLKELGCHVWGYDPDMKKRLEHSFDLCGSKIEDIITADAFVIASPTSNHFDDFIATTSKPTFIEKPIFATQKELDIATPGIWAGGKRPQMVGYNLRFRSCVIAAKEWMKMIGEPIWANFTVAQYNDKYIDSVILNWSHEIDLALYLLGSGRVTGCSARPSVGRECDIADILIIHENGCHSSVHLDYVTKPEVRQFIVVGSQATIIVDVVHNQAWLRGADETIWDHSEEVDSFDDNYKDEMQAFIDRIDGKDVIGCTGSEALEVLKVCLEARKQAGF